MRDVIVPDACVLADPVDDYIKRIRAGFVLLQAGMAFGLIRDCIALMEQVKGPLGHVNKYLDVQPEHDRRAARRAWRPQVARLAATPFETDPAYWRAVIEARLAAGEASVAAAHAAMLHCGARGYVAGAAAQRRLREAYFVAIVTPATKQLKQDARRHGALDRARDARGASPSRPPPSTHRTPPCARDLPADVQRRTQERRMTEKVLVTPAELSDMITSPSHGA